MDIDYVVPMVFDDDVQWQNCFATRRRVYDYRAGSNVRYRTWGTEPLLVSCIRKFMPFVRTIYIILAHESQKKSWMDNHGEQDVPQVKVVYHKDFIPREYLPCFNSCTIEMFIPYIDCLSEHFVYGNDDMFPVSPMTVDNFFKEGLPVQHLTEKNFPDSPNLFHRKCKNQQMMVAGAFGKDSGNIWYHNGHCLAPLLRSSCLEVRDRFHKEVLDGITPSRSETSYNQYLYVLWQFFTGRYVDGRVSSTYLSVKDSPKYVEDVIRDAHGVVCVNDNECVRDISDHASAVRSAIKYKLSV